MGSVVLGLTAYKKLSGDNALNFDDLSFMIKKLIKKFFQDN